MRLKRLEDIQWEDLPKIESPFFARGWVESNLQKKEGPFQIEGLDNVLWDGFGQSGTGWSEASPEHLLDQVENGELFLIHDLGSDPFEPVVRRAEDDRTWELAGTYTLQVQFNLQRMFEQAAESRGLWEPVAKREKGATAAQVQEAGPEPLSVTNPRWEHLDEARADSRPDAAMAGDPLVLKVDVSGAADGSSVSFKVYDSAQSPRARVGSVRGQVEGGIGAARWEASHRPGAKLEFEGSVRRVSSGPAEIPVIEPAPLRLGIFFDGTDNDMKDRDTFSNIAKLYEAYDGDEQTVFALYKRGVGTDGGFFNDRFGAAFGRGGQERIEGMLWAVLDKIRGYHKGSGELPKRILLDVFGFSRGAAIARWFVNVIKQGAYTFEAPYDDISPDVFSIQFLGLFDTVGSFGLPGNDIDCGTCFHIKSSWIEGRVVQLVADDEHRSNFDIQTLFQVQKNVPVDIQEGGFFERVVPGAHADAGGGYGSGREHGRVGNQLGRIHLHLMHEEASRSGVPLKDIAARLSDSPDHWSVDPRVLTTYETLMGAYESHPGLQREHKILRELQRGLEWAEYQLDLVDGLYWDGDVMHMVESLRWEDAVKSLRTRLHSQRETMVGHFETADEERDFFEAHNQLYAGHIHRSHAPFNPGIGMGPEVRKDGRLQREVFYDRFDKLSAYEPRRFDD